MLLTRWLVGLPGTLGKLGLLGLVLRLVRLLLDGSSLKLSKVEGRKAGVDIVKRDTLKTSMPI